MPWQPGATLFLRADKVFDPGKLRQDTTHIPAYSLFCVHNNEPPIQAFYR